MSDLTRRAFVQGSIAAAATVTIAGTKSSGKVLGANDTIRVAVAGLNGRGGAHVRAFAPMKNVQVVCLVDPDTRCQFCRGRARRLSTGIGHVLVGADGLERISGPSCATSTRSVGASGDQIRTCSSPLTAGAGMVSSRHEPGAALYDLALIWSNGLLLYVFTAWVAGRLYRRGFFASGTSRTSTLSSPLSNEAPSPGRSRPG